MATGYERVVSALESRGLVRTGWGTGVQSLCPAHDDQRPSLKVDEGEDGRALVYCHAGCSVYSVIEALGLETGDLFSGAGGSPTTQLYVYTDEDNKPLSRVHRTDPKGFWQERYEDGEWKPGLRDVRRVLYNLPKVRKAIKIGRPLYLVEGEKDVHTLEEHGIIATTVLGGANKWDPSYAETLRGGHVVIVGDNDDAGRQHVSKVQLALLPVAHKVQVYFPKPECKDITDHLDAGYSIEELCEDPVSMASLDPFDWEEYETPETEWHLEPWVPKQARVLAFGAAGSLKSLWALWLAAKLAGESKHVAYLSLEMTKGDLARRLKQLAPPRDYFHVYAQFSFTSQENLVAMLRGMRGYDLIVVDSWSAAQRSGGNNNDDVASLDLDVFQPLVEQTGATLLILDNVGHPSFTDVGKMTPDWARGASAKGDKMDVTLYFNRPYEHNNYRTTISMKKMRLDQPMPASVTVETRKDEIEFYHVDTEGQLTEQPMWPSLQVVPWVEPPRETAYERRVRARLADQLGKVEL